MSITERIGRQILPILVCTVGIAMLAWEFLLPGGAYHGGADGALYLCGIGAAVIQLCAVLLFTKRKKYLVAVLDGTVAVLSVLIFVYGEPVVTAVTGVAQMLYYFTPGREINAIAACVAILAIVAMAFFPKDQKTEAAATAAQ